MFLGSFCCRWNCVKFARTTSNTLWSNDISLPPLPRCHYDHGFRQAMHTRVTRHRRYWHFDIWHTWSVIFLKVGGMRFLKQCLQALLPAPSPVFFFFKKILLVPRPLFRSTPLTESLEQAKTLQTFENTREMKKTLTCGSCFLHFPRVLKCPLCFITVYIITQVL